MNSKVLIVYHRTPYEEVIKNGEIVFKFNSRPNGIISLLKNFLSLKGSVTWIAGSTLISATKTTNPEQIKFDKSSHSFLLKRVAISKEELHEFYHLTSKEGFWPILHSFNEKFNYSKINWDSFVEINERFADATSSEWDENSIIWIHDYNLWLVPYFIRKKHPEAKIAFFLHTPFPSADIFNMLSWRKQIVRSLLSCNLIAFAIPRYVENFVSVSKSNFNVITKIRERVDPNLSNKGYALSEPYITKEILFEGKTIRLEAVQVGPDCECINESLTKYSVNNKKEEIKKIIGDRKLIFAASRIDYIKGTDRLLECYKRLLDKRKDLINKLTLVVIAVDPADGICVYDDLRTKIIELIAEINEGYSIESWSPIIYIKDALSLDEMVSWYSETDIMWVPSLRDGTNLVCKEYLAVKGNNPGILMISEFMGATVELSEAIIFNPYSPASMDEAINTALQMSSSEQIRRNTNMYKKVLLTTPRLWAKHLAILNNNVKETQD